jgi:hypothetical protein
MNLNRLRRRRPVKRKRNKMMMILTQMTSTIKFMTPLTLIRSKELLRNSMKEITMSAWLSFLRYARN